MTYTLTRDGVNSGNPVTLSNVQSETGRILSTIIVLPLPASPSTETDVFDFGGVTEEITIEGKKVDTLANIATFVGYFTGTSGFINGDQSTSGNSTLVSDIRGSISAKVDSFDYNVTYGMGSSGNTICVYTLKVVRSSSR
jgi:hypothetical protein